MNTSSRFKPISSVSPKFNYDFTRGPPQTPGAERLIVIERTNRNYVTVDVLGFHLDSEKEGRGHFFSCKLRQFIFLTPHISLHG